MVVIEMRYPFKSFQDKFIGAMSIAEAIGTFEKHGATSVEQTNSRIAVDGDDVVISCLVENPVEVH